MVRARLGVNQDGQGCSTHWHVYGLGQGASQTGLDPRMRWHLQDLECVHDVLGKATVPKVHMTAEYRGGPGWTRLWHLPARAGMGVGHMG